MLTLRRQFRASPCARRAVPLTGNLAGVVGRREQQPGKAIGVHSKVSLVQALPGAGLADKMRIVPVPALARRGRRLTEYADAALHWDVQSARSTSSGMQFLVCTPRR